MTYQELDFIFPFIVFGYGVLMTLAMNHPRLVRLADEKFPQGLVDQMRGHRFLGVLCLVLGGLWSLQNLWFTNPVF